VEEKLSIPQNERGSARGKNNESWIVGINPQVLVLREGGEREGKSWGKRQSRNRYYPVYEMESPDQRTEEVLSKPGGPGRRKGMFAGTW